MKSPFRPKPIVVTDEMAEKGARLLHWILYCDAVDFVPWERLPMVWKEDKTETMKRVLERALSVRSTTK